jgi:hypothetical protein
LDFEEITQRHRIFLEILSDLGGVKSPAVQPMERKNTSNAALSRLLL